MTGNGCALAAPWSHTAGAPRKGFSRAKGIDYFENSRRATYAQQEYAIRNPRGFAGYHKYAWGVTASDGPGDVTKVVDGVERRFYGYMARTIPPDRPDDGTLPAGESGWISDGYYGLDQGPIVIMIENYFTNMVWRLMRLCQAWRSHWTASSRPGTAGSNQARSGTGRRQSAGAANRRGRQRGPGRGTVCVIRT